MTRSIWTYVVAATIAAVAMLSPATVSSSASASLAQEQQAPLIPVAMGIPDPEARCFNCNWQKLGQDWDCHPFWPFNCHFHSYVFRHEFEISDGPCRGAGEEEWWVRNPRDKAIQRPRTDLVPVLDEAPADSVLESGGYCAWCEGPTDSECHDEWQYDDEDTCHVPCGTEVNNKMPLIERALKVANAGEIARMLHGSSMFVFNDERGSIQIRESCNSKVMAINIPLPGKLARELGNQLELLAEATAP